MHDHTRVFNGFLCVLQSECEQRGESYWYSVTASLVTRIVENIEVYTRAMMSTATLLGVVNQPEIQTKFRGSALCVAEDPGCPPSI